MPPDWLKRGWHGLNQQTLKCKGCREWKTTPPPQHPSERNSPVFSIIAPIIWLFVTSFKTVAEINSNEYHLFPEVFQIRKVLDVWNKVNFGRYYLNTLIVVLGSMLCSVVFNGLLAYAVGVLKPVGHKIINGLVLLGYMVPAALAIFPLSMQIVELKLMNSYIPLCLMFGANAYYYLLFKDSFEKVPVA